MKYINVKDENGYNMTFSADMAGIVELSGGDIRVYEKTKGAKYVKINDAGGGATAFDATLVARVVSALVEAAQTPWHNVVIDLDLSGGYAVSSITPA